MKILTESEFFQNEKQHARKYMKKYSTLVLIGRFQPFTNAHLEIVRRAFQLTDKLIIMIGSANQPPTLKNPWSAPDRATMIRDALKALPVSNTSVVFGELNDYLVDGEWAENAEIEIMKLCDYSERRNIGIIGFKKDESSFYLDDFPQWELEDVGQIGTLNATDIRKTYFSDAPLEFLSGVLPHGVLYSLSEWKESSVYSDLLQEKAKMEKDCKPYLSLPYPPVFVTVDNLVIYVRDTRKYILMVQRKNHPGKGLFALPGGFFNANDTSIKSAAHRELLEETGFVIRPTSWESEYSPYVIDTPNRSARGRTITHVFSSFTYIGRNEELPEVKGSDDAAWAGWIPFDELQSDKCFEDHFRIIQSLISEDH